MTEPLPALEPCPWCCGGAVISADMTDYPKIACDACGAIGPSPREPGIQAAIDHWNARRPAGSVVRDSAETRLREAVHDLKVEIGLPRTHEMIARISYALSEEFTGSPLGSTSGRALAGPAGGGE